VARERGWGVTAKDWEESEDGLEMYVWVPCSRRKSLLSVAACFRRFKRHRRARRSRYTVPRKITVQDVESLAESPTQTVEIGRRTWEASWGMMNRGGDQLTAFAEARDASWRIEATCDRPAVADILREVLGNPFRPALAFTPAVFAFHDDTVRKLATVIYEDPDPTTGLLDPTRLAILADALEDAGADDDAALAHLRGPGPHCRGCHVVDAVLGWS
jgi:hypothetical protein